MRPVRKITEEEEGARVVRFTKFSGFATIKRNPVKPEPEGTIVLMAFRVTGYDPDCDGSLMARLEQVDKNGKTTGWETTNVGLYPDTDLVVSPKELKALFDAKA